MAKAKFGEGHVEAMFRIGAQEIARYLPAFNQAGQSVTEDQGIWPNTTPGHIDRQRGEGNQQLSMDELRTYAAERAKEAEKSMENQNQQSQGRGM